MNLTRQQLAIAGIAGAVAATGAVANATASHAATTGAHTTTSSQSAAAQLQVSIAPGACTAADATKHRQVSSVTITVPKTMKYDVHASVENKPGSLGGVEEPGLVRYADSHSVRVKPGQTVKTTLRWSANVRQSYLTAYAEATNALGGDIKNVKLGGTHGRHNYSTQCDAAPTLGLANWGGPHTRGFGQARPTVLDNGGDPTGLVSKVSWATWRGSTADGTGISTYVPPNKPVAQGIPTRAKIRAYDLTTCGGHPAYRHVTWWFPSKGETYQWAVKNHVESYDLCSAS